MRKHNHSRFFIQLLVILLLFSVATGCKPEPTAAPQPTPEPAIPTPEPSPTAAPQRLVLVDPNGAAATGVVTLLTEFATSNALIFETMANLDQVPPTAEMRIIVFNGVPNDLDNLAASAPQTQFIVIGDVDPAGRANLSAVRVNSGDVAFMAGYLTMQIAWDWRAAGLIPSDTALGADYSDAFENGGRYLCGQCTSTYAPFYYFPLVAAEVSQAGAGGWQAQTNQLVEYFVKAVYVDPSAALPEVLDSLTVQGMTLVGREGTPLAERFTALVGADALPGLQQLLPQALAGTGGTSVAARVQIVSFTDETIISPGKIQAFNETAANLAAGIIYPFSIQ